MAINLNLLKPFELTAGIEKQETIPQFFLNTFFKNKKIHNEDTFVYEVYQTSDGIAKFADEAIEGFSVNKGIKTVKSLTIPATNEKKIFTAKELNEFMILDAIKNPNMKKQYQLNYINQNLQSLKNRVYRLREKLAVEMLLNGTITINQDNGVATIDFEYVSHATNGHKTTLTTKWDASGAKPTEDLTKYSRIIAKRTGITPKYAIIGPDVCDVLTSKEAVLKELNNNNLAVGKLELNNGWDSSVRYIGRLRGLEVYEYVGTYKNANNTATDIFDASKVLIVADDGTSLAMHHAPINTINGKIIEDIYVGSYEDPKGMYIEWNAKQKSLPVIHNPDLIYSLTVL